MLIKDQFGIIQNLQTSSIPQNQFLSWDFFCRFLQQDGSRSSEPPYKSSWSRQYLIQEITSEYVSMSNLYTSSKILFSAAVIFRDAQPLHGLIPCGAPGAHIYN